LTHDPATPRDRRLPPESFYWAVLDTGALPARAARRPARHPDKLGYLFEAVLPVPIERVQACYLPMDGRRVLACGMDIDRVAELATQGVLTLGPASVPGFLGGAPDPGKINLLHGRFEPGEIGRARGRFVGVCAAAVLACSALILAGQTRRASFHNLHARACADATASVYARVLPPSAGPLPPAARLTAELRALDRTRGAHPAEHGPREVAPILAALLARWPADLPVTTETLTVSDTAITLTARLPDSAAAERFERELGAPEGWRMAQPEVRAERDGVLVRARMEPTP
jgi:hypothetical protein